MPFFMLILLILWIEAERPDEEKLTMTGEPLLEARERLAKVREEKRKRKQERKAKRKARREARRRKRHTPP